MTEWMGKSYCAADGSLSSSGKTAGSSGVEKYASELNKFLAKVHVRLTKGTEAVSVRLFHLSSANMFRLNLIRPIYTRKASLHLVRVGQYAVSLALHEV